MIITQTFPNGPVITQEAPVRQAIDPCRLLDPTAPPVVARTTPAPWGIPLTAAGAPDVLGGVKFAGLLPVDFVIKQHIHAHLDIYINGVETPIPANLGLPNPPTDPNITLNWSSPMHTHDFDPVQGIIHIEQDESPFNVTVGNFFGIWEVRLNQQCIGGYCANSSHPLKAYVNGVQYSGSPANIVLHNHDEVAIVYGASPAGGVPSSFDFASAGY